MGPSMRDGPPRLGMGALRVLDMLTDITKKEMAIPRLPLEGEIDLTYRCNCNCRHCWLRLPAEDPAGERELSVDEIGRIVAEARAMGCRRWSISGGEPMLRPDFAEIFDVITRRSLPYSLNTNGTLITPAIAGLLKRKGAKMIALYGATEEIHDHITRTPGSFAATMRGFAYLREAKTGFTVQLIPMRDNYHQFDAMIRLARSLSPAYRMGAPWLYLSACRSAVRNREISCQRLDPADAIDLDPPDTMDDDEPASRVACRDDNRLFAVCIEEGRSFHVDPYGGMTFCPFIKDPHLRYNLRTGSFHEGWDDFLPSLADKVQGDREYRENCGRCEKRSDCRWCPAYGYLEHGRYPAKVSYLCRLADETRSFRENWRRHHRRYFRIAGVTVRVDSDVPFTEETFDPKFKPFQADGPGEEMILLRHHFCLPDFDGDDPGTEVYRRPPWAIYRKDESWIYLGIANRRHDEDFHCAAAFNDGHTRGRIYNRSEALFRRGRLHSLTLFPSDQILLARALADRQACFLHAAGVVINGKGLLFVGHSGAGKTTAAKMLRKQGEVLCDDRIIVRRWPDGLCIHGTWSHGDLADISAASAPLSAILFLEKADVNRLIPVAKGIETARLLVQYPVKPLVTADWWEKILALIEHMARDVPAYRLQFDKSGRMKNTIVELL
ncbi:MAG: radical SAM protein [Deltaproteobacteria bacterium]|nr:radical SAM protein [Deltaproteobacteria bacterium]